MIPNKWVVLNTPRDWFHLPIQLWYAVGSFIQGRRFARYLRSVGPIRDEFHAGYLYAPWMVKRWGYQRASVSVLIALDGAEPTRQGRIGYLYGIAVWLAEHADEY